MQASHDLAPCSRHCQGLHAVAVVVDGRLRTRSLPVEPGPDIVAAARGDLAAIERLRANLDHNEGTTRP